MLGMCYIFWKKQKEMKAKSPYRDDKEAGRGLQGNERTEVFLCHQLCSVLTMSVDNRRVVSSGWASVFKATYWCVGKAEFSRTGP